MSPHFLACSKIVSTSSLNSLLLTISYLSSLAITVIVDNGVPKECAAAAAW